MSNLENIPNFLQINDNLATAGQPSREQFADIKEAGYELVINIGLLESPGALPDERRVVTEQGMTYVQIPVVFEAPQIEEVARFCDLMLFNPDKKIFVHCVANKRVACFVYLYRILVKGDDEAQAKQDLLRAWTPDATWQGFIDDALVQLR
ncbi:MAG TPA: protein tyrosine phosphatase family protein [Abditibacteriaceae bacterium]|jgi:protein tyrosine phosphatase (PTP) superfamily phosphohydrolase (DUF442 family)